MEFVRIHGDLLEEFRWQKKGKERMTDSQADSHRGHRRAREIDPRGHQSPRQKNIF